MAVRLWLHIPVAGTPTIATRPTAATLPPTGAPRGLLVHGEHRGFARRRGAIGMREGRTNQRPSEWPILSISPASTLLTIISAAVLSLGPGIVMFGIA